MGNATGSLTSRQREILLLIAEGLTDKEIATRLSVSLETIKYHVSVILQKLAAANQAAPRTEKNTGDATESLTNRQQEILLLIADGLTNKEIATRLSVSLDTVKHHVSVILQKLTVPNRAAAATKLRESTQDK